MIKMIVEVWKQSHLSDEAFAERWLVEHGNLVRIHAQAMGFVRYIQSHKLSSPEIAAFAEGRGWKAPPDGLTEVWWDTKETMVAAMSSAAGQAASAALAADEVQFIESSKISAFLAEEKVIFDFVARDASVVEKRA